MPWQRRADPWSYARRLARSSGPTLAGGVPPGWCRRAARNPPWCRSSARRGGLVQVERIDHVVTRVRGADGVVDVDQEQAVSDRAPGNVDAIHADPGLVMQDRVRHEVPDPADQPLAELAKQKLAQLATEVVLHHPLPAPRREE